MKLVKTMLGAKANPQRVTINMTTCQEAPVAIAIVADVRLSYGQS